MTKLSRVIHSPTLDDHLLHVSGQHLISEKNAQLKKEKKKTMKLNRTQSGRSILSPSLIMLY